MTTGQQNTASAFLQHETKCAGALRATRTCRLSVSVRAHFRVAWAMGLSLIDVATQLLITHVVVPKTRRVSWSGDEAHQHSFADIESSPSLI